MSLTTKVLIALALGMALGVVISTAQSPALSALVPLVEPLGTLWINAIRMTVVPLVIGTIVGGAVADAQCYLLDARAPARAAAA
mgnify:CR=1 FL=1